MWRYTVLRSSNCTVHVGFCSIQLAAHSLTKGGAESQPVHQRSQTLRTVASAIDFCVGNS